MINHPASIRANSAAMYEQGLTEIGGHLQVLQSMLRAETVDTPRYEALLHAFVHLKQEQTSLRQGHQLALAQLGNGGAA